MSNKNDCACGGNALGDTNVCDTCGGQIILKAKVAKGKKLISWRCCGFDLADRTGTVGLKKELQIQYSRGKYDLSFHHAQKKAGFDDLEEAKQYAEDHILEWQEAREKERKAYETQRIADSRKAASAQQRQTDLVNQLKALGIDARDGIGIQISHEAAQELVLRLQGKGVGKVPQLVTKPTNPEPMGHEMMIG